MTATLDAAIAEVVGALDTIDDPVLRNQTVSEAEQKITEALRGVRRRIALELHATGRPWREVGEAMGGLTAQRAWQISRGE